MTKVSYTSNASRRHPTQYFAVSQSKVPCFDLMSSITSGITTSPQNRFLYSCVVWLTIRKTGKKHVKKLISRPNVNKISTTAGLLVCLHILFSSSDWSIKEH